MILGEISLVVKLYFFHFVNMFAPRFYIFRRNFILTGLEKTLSVPETPMSDGCCTKSVVCVVPGIKSITACYEALHLEDQNNAEFQPKLLTNRTSYSSLKRMKRNFSRNKNYFIYQASHTSCYTMRDHRHMISYCEKIFVSNKTHHWLLTPRKKRTRISIFSGPHIRHKTGVFCSLNRKICIFKKGFLIEHSKKDNYPFQSESSNLSFNNGSRGEKAIISNYLHPFVWKDLNRPDWKLYSRLSASLSTSYLKMHSFSRAQFY